MRKLVLMLAMGMCVLGSWAHAETTTEGQRVETEILEDKSAYAGRRYLTVEPGFQYSLISSNRLDVSGYTIPPAFVLGRIQVEKIRKQILAPSLTFRFGIADLFQTDLRIPYILREDEYSYGAANNFIVQDIEGDDLGDIEGSVLVTALKESKGWPGISVGLKVKSDTGKDPYGIKSVPLQTEEDTAGPRGFVPVDLPTGSGHWGFTPFITVAKTVDPAVLFGSISYFYHMKEDVTFTSRTTEGEEVRTEAEVDPSDYLGYSLGLAYALNDRLAMSTAFEQKFYTKAEVDGRKVKESDIILGSLTLGATYSLNDRISLNLSLGIGLTPDSPDMDVSLRVPFRYGF